MSLTVSVRRVAIVFAALVLLGAVPSGATAAPLLPRPGAISGVAGTSWQEPIAVTVTVRGPRRAGSGATTARLFLLGGRPGSNLRFRLGTLAVPALRPRASKTLTASFTPTRRLRAAGYRLALCVGVSPKTRCVTSKEITLRVPQPPQAEVVPSPTPSPSPSTTPTPAPPTPTPTPTPAPAPAKLAVSESVVDFGAYTSLATAPERTITVSNTGTVASGPLAITIPEGFDEVAPLTCGKAPLAGGASCVITLRPLIDDWRNVEGDVVINAGAQTGGSVSVAVFARARTAAAPKLELVAGSPSWGPTQVDRRIVKVLTFKNTGGVAFGELGFGLTGPGIARFELVGGGCTNVAPGDTCSVTLAGSAPNTSTYQASLTISGDAPEFTPTPLTLSITGVTVFPGVSFSDSKAFLSTPVIGQTVSREVTIVPTNAAAVHNLSLSLSGAQASSFGITNDTCSGTDLLPGAKCTFTLTFTPASADTVGCYVILAGEGFSFFGQLETIGQVL